MTHPSRSSAVDKRIALALATLVVWAAITVFGAGTLQSGHRSLEDIVAGGIAWQVLLAALALLAVIAWRGWRDMGFRTPEPGTLKLLWLPALLLLFLFLLTLGIGLPPVGTALLVLMNSMLVGFSEETMFRGVLYRALRGRFRIWPAILWSSAGFGGIHVLNGFVTGEFEPALLQSVLAACSGLLLMAIFLRTGSLWLAILYHGLWDWVTFLLVLGASEQAEAQGGTAAAATSPAQALVPALLILPNFLYAIWLLRSIHTGTPPGDQPSAARADKV